MKCIHMMFSSFELKAIFRDLPNVQFHGFHEIQAMLAKSIDKKTYRIENAGFSDKASNLQPAAIAQQGR